MGNHAGESEKLADFVRKLGDEFELYKQIDENYGHIGATIADAVLQANRDYEKIVLPRVTTIRNKWCEATTTSALRELLNTISVCQFLDYRSKERADRFLRVLDLLIAEGIENEDELRCWLQTPDSRKKLRAIKGIGPKTADYFGILVGLADAAVDRHLYAFLDEAGISYKNYGEAKEIINGCADILCIDRARFDHSIWRYRRKRSQRNEVRRCDSEVVKVHS